MTKRFPRTPQLGPRSFDEANGANPFVDEPGKMVQYSESHYGGPSTGEVQPYRPGDYVATMADRSSRVLAFGLGGLLFSLTSVLILLFALGSGGLSSLLIYSWPVDLFALALSIPAWVMGSSDLRAIRAGAMACDHQRRTRVAYWCGCVATLAGLIPWILSVIAIVLGRW